MFSTSEISDPKPLILYLKYKLMKHVMENQVTKMMRSKNGNMGSG